MVILNDDYYYYYSFSFLFWWSKKKEIEKELALSVSGAAHQRLFLKFEAADAGEEQGGATRSEEQGDTGLILLFFERDGLADKANHLLHKLWKSDELSTDFFDTMAHDAMYRCMRERCGENSELHLVHATHVLCPTSGKFFSPLYDVSQYLINLMIFI